jgi:hypothetical protein
MTMNFSPPAELLEATRLTKAGQLTEATASLQEPHGSGIQPLGRTHVGYGKPFRRRSY